MRGRDIGVERTLVGIGPLFFEVGDPARADHHRRAVAVDRVREPAAFEVDEAEVLLHVGEA
jgi:hypothetical protein